MTAEKAFNGKINQFLIEQPKSLASETINKIKRFYTNKSSYYSMFDDIVFKLGIEIIPQEVVDDKTEATLGYIPIIQYNRENKLKEQPHNELLISQNSPMPLFDCYEYLAKKLLYRIMKISNLDELIKKE